jgi:hypothetical protein
MQATHMCWADLAPVTRVCILVSEKVHMQELEKIEEIVQRHNQSITHSRISEMLCRRGILWDHNVFLSWQAKFYYMLSALYHVKTYERAKRLASNIMFIINHPDFKDSSSSACES